MLYLKRLVHCALGESTELVQELTLVPDTSFPEVFERSSEILSQLDPVRFVPPSNVILDPTFSWPGVRQFLFTFCVTEEDKSDVVEPDINLVDETKDQPYSFS